MLHRKAFTGMFAAASLLILILDGKTALTGAADGLELCIRSVIPSMFPFFVLTNLMIAHVSIGWMQTFSVRLGIPRGAEGILMAGALGGYPTGAQAIANSWLSGNLTVEQANRMLRFCCNAGPAFLFGMVAPMFESVKYPWLLWGIHILSALIVALIRKQEPDTAAGDIHFPALNFSQALKKAIHTMVLVCGWILLFRIVLAFLEKWFLRMLAQPLRILICGLLELSNGCSMLSEIPSGGLRFLLADIMLNFGGCCVTMQTASVIDGLSLTPYLTGKLAQTMFSAALSCIVQPILPDPCRISPIFPTLFFCAGLIAVYFPEFRKKAVAFLKIIMYNTDNQNQRRDTYAVS